MSGSGLPRSREDTATKLEDLPKVQLREDEESALAGRSVSRRHGQCCCRVSPGEDS